MAVVSVDNTDKWVSAGRCKLGEGDCLELLKELPDSSIDLVLCDPPYGIDYQSCRVEKDRRKAKIKNDREPFVAFIPEVKRLLKDTGAALIFTRWDVQQKFIDEMKNCGLNVRNVLIWDKVVHGMGDLKRAYGSRYESIIFASGKSFSFPGKRPTDILRFKRVDAARLVHPNEKPVELLEELIKQTTEEGATVLDCTMGSGSCGVACVNTGRNFVGIELDDEYFQIAKQRIEQAGRNVKE